MYGRLLEARLIPEFPQRNEGNASFISQPPRPFGSKNAVVWRTSLARTPLLFFVFSPPERPIVRNFFFNILDGFRRDSGSPWEVKFPECVCPSHDIYTHTGQRIRNPWIFKRIVVMATVMQISLWQKHRYEQNRSWRVGRECSICKGKI